MATINVSLPSDGQTADAADLSNPINTIVSEFNGNIDNANIKSAAAISGSKLADNSIDLEAKASSDSGWREVTDSWAYASATTITVPTDATTKYKAGDKVKLVQSATTKYFDVVSVTSTVLTVKGVTTETVANSAISDIYYSKVSTPQGYTPTPFWQEIGRTTLTVAGDTITVSSIPARKYLRIISQTTATGGTIINILRLNGDTGANYSSRYSADGAADSTATAQTSAFFRHATVPSGGNAMAISELSNIASVEKNGNLIAYGTNTAGTGAAQPPQRVEGAIKWANTADQITSVSVINSGGTGDFAIGSEVVVLGHD